MRKLLVASALFLVSSGACAATCTNVAVTFKVTDPAAVETESMFVNGDQPALGPWAVGEANRMKRDGQSKRWSATFQLPPETNLQFKFMKRTGGTDGKDVWERGIATYSQNRELRTPACDTKNFTVDGGNFREAERDHNRFTDDLSAPGGNKGARIRALVDAFNAGSAAATREFFARHATPAFAQSVPMAMHEQIFAERFSQTGGFDLRGTRAYQLALPETTVLLQDRAFGSWHGLFIAFEPGGEQRISGISLQNIAVPKQPPLTEAAFVAEVRATIDRACKGGFFSGAVRVQRQGDVLVEAACGEASKRYHVANNIDTRFNLGSMNKMFTSIAISQLVERGKLKYSDSIDQFVDETWLPKDITRQITIHHLLSHTSGLGSYFNDKYWNSSRLLYRDVNDYKPLVAGDKPAFKPGEKFSYSNTGMLLLGVVIEKVTGQSYFDFIRANVTGPAGMTSTESYAMDEPVENLATGHTHPEGQPNKWVENSLLHVLKGGPAGGGYSTVRDLDKFATALLAGKLVKPETLALHWRDVIKARYGYGFQVTDRPGNKVVGHSGGFPGLNGQLDIYLDKKVVIAALANQDDAASTLAGRIGQLLERVP